MLLYMLVLSFASPQVATIVLDIKAKAFRSANIYIKATSTQYTLLPTETYLVRRVHYILPGTGLVKGFMKYVSI